MNTTDAAAAEIAIGWLTDKKYALIAVKIVSVWMAIGMNFIYLTAAIQSVPAELYESVALDGANFFQKHRHVTIPSISPTLFFLLIINVINSVQAYAEFKMMTQGGPAESTNVIVYEIYQEAFINSRFGVACAESVVLFVILIIHHTNIEAVDNRNDNNNCKNNIQRIHRHFYIWFFFHQ